MQGGHIGGFRIRVFKFRDVEGVQGRELKAPSSNPRLLESLFVVYGSGIRV